MAEEPIQLTIHDAVATLTLDRPKALNSLNRPLIDSLRRALRSLAKDSSVRVLILTGAGRGFCAGADLAGNDFLDGTERTPGEAMAYSMEIAFNPLISDLVNFPKPVIAAVNGVAAGGVSLALGCDIVVAAQSAYFSQVFGPRLDLVPDMGCTWLAPRILGRARARALTLLGDRISADMAAQWGMIWLAVPDNDPDERGRQPRRAAGQRPAGRLLEDQDRS